MSSPAAAARPGRGWSLERVLFAIAGWVTLASAVLALVSPWFLALTAFVGANQLLYVIAGDCPMSLVLRRTCDLKEAGR
ncbi:MAG: DUF2892 domain-containing protein [Thermoleophilia bacterium]|nr:DUF2892 domain-containing protein [Thermoleophilia bacterium]MDH3724882.1 DUF2892 domain-containing protein [Thermoleophilia bacterium]